jgi:hypothetical protein
MQFLVSRCTPRAHRNIFLTRTSASLKAKRLGLNVTSVLHRQEYITLLYDRVLNTNAVISYVFTLAFTIFSTLQFDLIALKLLFDN